MQGVSIPEEFIIIGSALRRIGDRVTLDTEVTLERIKEYLKDFKIPITYDEIQNFKYCKREGDKYIISSQPMIPPQLLQILIDKTL